jgi:geranylgeranyl diphosphate synthase type I
MYISIIFIRAFSCRPTQSLKQEMMEGLMATNGNTAAELLAEYSRRLDPVFHEYFEAKMLEASGISPHCRNMVACIREFTLHGGKRIRPALVYYGYKCFADGNEDEILKASISMELLHSYLLIHDDIMDGDALRRNCPTVHKIYESTPYAAAYRSAQDYGVAMGILAGDIGFGMAMDIILSAGFPIETRLRAARKLVDVATGVCHGQTLDIISSCNDEAGPDDAMLVNRYKTAFYTIEGPLCIGAALGGASDQDLAAFRDYALPLGEAFQIRDDILGLYGNQEKLGKPIGADLKEGKRTLLILKALDMADS